VHNSVLDQIITQISQTWSTSDELSDFVKYKWGIMGAKDQIIAKIFEKSAKRALLRELTGVS
jgi:hypothetical protein